MRTAPAVLMMALLLIAGIVTPCLAQPAFAPAVGVEAEQFTIEKGWKVLMNGQGNYMVDIIGFCHISGERLLSIDESITDASAYTDVQVPVEGPYRLWVRYEYPAFSEARFTAVVEQDGQVVAQQMMGSRESLRLGFGNATPTAQHDPSWGPEGLFVEAMDVPQLKAGPARIRLLAAEQPQIPGVSARRNIDLVYLTSDIENAWFAAGGGRGALYPELNAFRSAVGPRWEVRVSNQGDQTAAIHVRHIYNRVPWYVNDPAAGAKLEPGQTSDWTPLTLQDTAHFGMTAFTSSTGRFELEVRAIGGDKVYRYTSESNKVGVYLPPYAVWGEEPRTPSQAIAETLKLLEASPAPGRNPTLPLTYGGWIPLADETTDGRAYAQLYKAIGMRAFPTTGGSLPLMERIGLEPNRSFMIMAYRNPPTPANIAKAVAAVSPAENKADMRPYLQWYDYGDEIHFSEWLNVMASQRIAELGEKNLKAPALFNRMWRQWLADNRPGFKPDEYWLSAWGEPSSDALRPDSSAAAAKENPRLFVDSTLFYESAAMEYVAEGLRNVKQALGSHVLGGANYSCHPFYYPSITMYVRWFREGAADMGRHSEYFWQVAQPGPMINGYVAEHYRAGMRFNPQAVNRQYTMPHAPGNTDASFIRTAFSHLAHGAKMLDYFGIGMNEAFTENHIDHRASERYRSIRDVNYSIGLVEDMVLESQVVASPVAILLSDSTERWDLAPTATDRAGHSLFGDQFRKVRLHYHLERLGLWQAFTFAGVSPDLIIEEDLNADVLKGYKLLVLVGDSMAADKAAAVEAFAKQGGVVVATAGAGRFDTYRRPNPGLQALLGIADRELEEIATFLRPRQELPFIQPVDQVTGVQWTMPALAVREKITPAGKAETVARFGDQSPAVIRRQVGKGEVYYVAALPGVAYLWSALQPPLVPDRGINTHTVPTHFDAGAGALVDQLLQAAGIEPQIEVDGGLIDTRLVRGKGGYYLPIANYSAQVGQKVTLRVKLGDQVRQVTAAHAGELPTRVEEGRLVIELPRLGYGEMVRVDVK